MKQKKPSLTVTVEEAAELLGISRGSAYQAVKTGEIPALQIGGRILVPRARLLGMLGERAEAAPIARSSGEATSPRTFDQRGDRP